MSNGIDVSHYQGNIDWNRVKSSDVTFAIMKAMYETNKQKDEYFESNYSGCTNVGIYKGVYIYIGSKSTENPQEDAEALLEILNGRKLEYGIWIDIESDKLRELGRDRIEQIVFEEADIFEAAGYSVGVYCNLDWYKNVISDGIKKRFDGKMWIARYPRNDSGSVVSRLNPKNDCPEAIGWQYSSKGSVDGINGNVDMDMFWGEVIDKQTLNTMYSRFTIVNKSEEWIGKKSSDNSHCEILNIYNSNKPLPRGYAVKPTDAWCATFVSAVFIDCGYADIFPIECSCNQMLEKAKEMQIWVEDDSFVPDVGDVVLYDWQDNGINDNTGWPDHVGIVTYVDKQSGYMVVIEGNYDNAVKKRTINLNGKYIRGFITPKYTARGILYKDEKAITTEKEIAYEVIAGKWGNGDDRKNRLVAAGYNYTNIQQLVNEILNTPKKVDTGVNKTVIATSKAQKIDNSIAGTYITTADLYCRDGAGTNKKALVIIPKNTNVKCYGYYSIANGVKWYYIVADVNGVSYTGFSSSVYLRR